MNVNQTQQNSQIDDWFWTMNWCRKNGLSPANNEVWNKANQELITRKKQQ